MTSILLWIQNTYTVRKVKKKEKNKSNNKTAMNQQHVNCPPLSLSLSLSHTLTLILAHTQARAHERTYKGFKGS